MRRNDREIVVFEQLEKIIRKSKICRLGLCENNRAYVVPLIFGYRDRTLYFHSSAEGEKVRILRENPDVCFELDVDLGVVEGENGCDWSMRYQSIIGYGKAVIVEDLEQKRDALDILMANYSDKEFDYPFSSVEEIFVFKVDIESMTGKQSI